MLVRVRAAGICHSDAHYQAGLSPMGALPLTLGHEIAGVVERVGPGVREHAVGDRVCLHYLVTCGACGPCAAGRESFCERGAMLGHHVDGGFAEAITVPARNAVPLERTTSFAAYEATGSQAPRKVKPNPAGPAGPTSPCACATTIDPVCACEGALANCIAVRAVVASSTIRRFVMMISVPENLRK